MWGGGAWSLGAAELGQPGWALNAGFSLCGVCVWVLFERPINRPFTHPLTQSLNHPLSHCSLTHSLTPRSSTHAIIHSICGGATFGYSDGGGGTFTVLLSWNRVVGKGAQPPSTFNPEQWKENSAFPKCSRVTYCPVQFDDPPPLILYAVPTPLWKEYSEKPRVNRDEMFYS